MFRDIFESFCIFFRQFQSKSLMISPANTITQIQPKFRFSQVFGGFFNFSDSWVGFWYNIWRWSGLELTKKCAAYIRNIPKHSLHYRISTRTNPECQYDTNTFDTLYIAKCHHSLGSNNMYIHLNSCEFSRFCIHNNNIFNVFVWIW